MGELQGLDVMANSHVISGRHCAVHAGDGAGITSAEASLMASST